MRPIIEEFTVTSPELQINQEQGTRSNSVQQESERVQNVVFDSTNDTEPSTLGKMFEKSVIVCEDSDMEAPNAIPSSDEESRMSKRKVKPPTTKSKDFLWSWKGEQELEGATTVLYNVDKDGDQISHEDQAEKEDKLATKWARRLPTKRHTDFL
jgi:hypothetical protein